ncbi:hypothetical protein Afil01_46570 [Actinorhabdospora filicis]|uniref:Uncharacterized protein n=1 Tax=Actinorhabdospora filicis TaxID=1785913 RepID=A0A9W6WCJ5_9ACTN|nr:hypothetical protein [Actinorhabdospora filicis]GLZ79850.1 hypothetical protein Afil01_46570 [Actinorhabdospora filicis]
MRRVLRALVLTAVAAGMAFIASPAADAAPPTGPALVAPGTGNAVVEAQRHAVADAAGVAPTAVPCWINISIYSTANNRWISAELGYSGGDYAMLRARATAVGPWERYVVCRDPGTGVTDISSMANGLYVSAELGYSGGDYGMLRARASVRGPWEIFYTSSAPGGGRLVITSQANGLYVSAELGYSGGDYGMLRARASALGPWELYIW